MAKSRKYKDRLPIGEAIMEFYSALDTIEEYYTKKGYRKISMLHKVLKEKFGWKMPYDTFRYHFNKEFASKAKAIALEDDIKDGTPKKEDGTDGPIIAKANFSSGTKFNPHTIDLPPERKL